VLNKSYLHLAALELAAKGVPVFPCIPKGKRPATKNGFKDRTVDVLLINRWWEENPEYNIGIVPADCGFAVVDLDGSKGLMSWRDEYDWQSPATQMVRTPSGGLHLYYIGNVRPSASKLGPGIDTRGEDSYALAPPSYVVEEKKGYEGPYVLEDDRAPAPLPECVTERLNATAPYTKEAPEGVELDTAYNIAAAIEYLTDARRCPASVEGEGGHDCGYRVAAAVRDYGISPDCCLGMLEENWNDRCSPPWSQDELEEIVGHAYRYSQNEIGNRAVPPAVEQGWIAEAHRLRAEGKAGPDTQDRINAPDYTQERIETDGFEDCWIDDLERQPEPEFWDATKCLPRMPGGAVAIIYGDFGSHKTNTTLTLVLDAVFDKGAKVAYAAGEGAYGLGKMRVPAHCRARNIATKELRGRFALVPRVPLFAEDAQVERFIEARKQLSPNIIVLDTFATAMSGVDENNSQAAHFLTGNGAAGRIRREFDALVILPAHAGKDRSRGIRGNSGFGGNADVVIACDADKDAGVVKLTVEKMRDGADGHSLYFRIDTEQGGVPVPVRISEADYKERIGKAGGKAADEDQGKRLSVQSALTGAGADRFMAGLSDKQLAERMCGDEPEQDTEEWHRWLGAVGEKRRALRNARNRDAGWARGLWGVGASHEQATEEYRWFARPVEVTG
jgi:hypothetical protein